MTERAKVKELAVDLRSDTPIHLQIKDQIRYAIAVGELRAGDQLPSIRQLEGELGVNRNTVRRAYQELEHEGTLVLRQGATARVASKAPGPVRDVPSPRAAEWARRIIEEAEAMGLHSVRCAATLHEAAREHDGRYPRVAFVECSQLQADDFAQAAQRVFARRVVGVDLSGVGRDGAALPASVRHVLSTEWHVGELRRLLQGRGVTTHSVGVRLKPQFHDGVARLAGRTIGLLLRDAESVAGYRSLARKLARPQGAVRVALLGEDDAAVALMGSVQGLLYTTPCRGFVRAHAPPGLVAQEMLYEPVSEDLEILGHQLFALEEGGEP
ncbi:MAG: GntR family transcriptional regulator [Candidatus Latescibacterota bacterium]